MGLFDRLFGKKPAAPAASEPGEDDDIQSTGSRSVRGPPEFIRAVEIQRAYWTHNAAEQAQLEARGVEQLSWRERLRLHRLVCLQRLNPNPERAVATEKCRQTVRSLISPHSPYRPRAAMVWQGQSAQSGTGREPDMQGEFLNPSLTHLGCLEVYRVDAANQPIRLDFVSFDELSGVVFAPPNLIRAAKLFYDDGRGDIVLVPLLYGLTWAIGNEFDQAGRMTRFVAHLDGEEVGALGASASVSRTCRFAATTAGAVFSALGRWRRCHSPSTCATRGSTRRPALAASTRMKCAAVWVGRNARAC